MTTSLAVMRLRLHIFCCNPSQNLSERIHDMQQHTEYFSQLRRSHVCVYLLSDMLQTFCVGDLAQLFKLCIYFSLPLSLCFCSFSACLSPASYSVPDSFGLKLNFEVFSPMAHYSELDIFDIVSNPYSVPVSSGLDAVVYDDSQPSLLTPFI